LIFFDSFSARTLAAKSPALPGGTGNTKVIVLLGYSSAAFAFDEMKLKDKLATKTKGVTRMVRINENIISILY
jgi:hypothetical protein